MKKPTLPALALALVGCASPEPEVIPSEANLPSPPSISCHMAMVDMREKLKAAEILNDHAFLPEGPFKEMLERSTACSPLVLALDDALGREDDFCTKGYTEAILAEDSGENSDSVLGYFRDEREAIIAVMDSRGSCANARQPFRLPQIPDGNID